MSVLQYRFLGYARNDDKNSAALHYYLRRTNPVEPSEPIEPAEPLSHVIKWQHAPWAKFESRDE